VAKAKTLPAVPPRLPGDGAHAPHPQNPEQLARMYAALAAIPGVVEKTAWGSPTFRTGPDKTDRMFAHFVVDHHGDGRVAVWCAAPPGTQALLAETAPERTFVPPYVGKSGWIGLDLLKTDDEQLAHHLLAAWRWVAPKKRLALLDG
jgi:hypothetical protein